MDKMMLINARSRLQTYFFCLVIIIITIYGYYRIRNPPVLFISAGFTALINKVLNRLEGGFLESLKIYEFPRKHYSQEKRERFVTLNIVNRQSFICKVEYR